MNLGALVVRLLLERAQFRTELAQTVQETNAAASKVQGHAATITGAVTDAVNGQTTAVQTATRALSVLGPVAATATAAALAVGVAFHQAQQETLAYEKAIILSGNAAGVTSGQLADMARRIDGVAGTQANAAAALASMTAGGKVAQENLEKVALAAIEMERATGQAIGETEKIFSSLGKDPVKASLRLNESMNHLTASTYAQIKAADNLGETERAVSIAQNAAADVLRDRAAQVEKNLGTMERAWRGVRDLAKEAWDAMLNIGRPDSSADQLSKAGERVAYLEKQVDGRRSRGLATGDLDGQLAAAKALHDTLRETAKLDERAAGIKSDLAAKDKARLELALALEQSASKQEKMAIAIAQANALADRSGASVAERAQLVNAAREKYAEKESRAAKAALSDYDKLMQRLGTDVPKAAAEAEAAQHGYNKAQGEFLVLAGSPAWAKFTNEQRASAAAQFEKKIASEQAADAIKAEEKATVEATKAREKSLATAEKELEKLRASVVAQEEQNARLGLSKEAIAELDAAKLEMLATDVELQAIKVMDKNLDEAQYEILKRQAQAYRDLAQAKRDGAARSAAIESDKALEKAADKAAKEGEKASERIEQSLTDSLMRGFEAGKDMARNLRDTVVNMFKTMVLRPMVSAVVSPVAGAITGAMGLASAGQSGGGSAASTAMSAASLFGSGGIAGSLAAGAGWMTGATTLGGSLSAGASLLGTGTMAGAASGLGMIAGALGPIALGIALLSSLIKKSTPHMGAASSYSASAGLVSGADVYAGSGFADTRTYSAEAEKVTATMARSIGMALDDVAVTFGKKAGYEITAAFGDDSDKKSGAWGQLLIKQMGETIVDWRDTQTDKRAPKVFADGEEGGKQWQQAAAQSVREVIDGMGLPEWAARITRALPDSATMDDLTATLAQVKAYPAQLLQSFGTSRDAMVQQFAEGLATGNAAAAGQAVADTLVASVQNAVFTNAAGQIFDTVNMGIVTPMLDAIATGASVADALSQATIDKTIERAKAQAQALGELFGNAEFAAAMEQLRTAVGGALGQAGSYIQTLPQTLVATQQIDTAAQDAARAADEAQRAWQQITDALLGDQASLQIELLRAQGREEEALARERALAIEGMDAYQTALYDSNRALRSQIDTLRELGELLPSVIDQYLTPEQRTSNAYGTIANDLVGAGLAGMDAGALAQALAGATKGEIAEAATAIYQMTGVTDEMRVALLRAAGSLATLKDEAASVADAGLDSGYAALERAVQARRSVVQETVNDVRAVFDTVRSAARDLFGEVDSVVQFNAQAGRAYITQALGAARSTGYLPDGEQLSEAIGAARAGLNAQTFASQAEADYQRLVLANELKALQDISGDQLTEAELQLKALDGILETTREQIDELRGIKGEVMTVEAALSNIAAIMLAAQTGKTSAGVAAGSAGAAGAMPDWATFGTGDWTTSSTGSLVLDNSTGMVYGPGDLTSHRAQLRDAAAALVEAGQNQELYDAVQASGFTLAQAETFFGMPEGKAEDWARSLGLPIFHQGTPYVPRTGFALLEQGERVMSREENLAFNPFTGGAQGGNNNARLEALVEQLTAKVAQLETATRATALNTAKSAEVLASVQKGNSLVMVPAVTF